MLDLRDWMREPARDGEVAAAPTCSGGRRPRGDRGGLGGGPQRRVTLLVERYAHLGGLASGGMVLCWTTWGTLPERVTCGAWPGHDRPHERPGPGAYPREVGVGRWAGRLSRWSRWGTFDFTPRPAAPDLFAIAFDPDGWKRVALADREAQGSIYGSIPGSASADGREPSGRGRDTKEGRQALLGDVVIDASGDVDVAAAAGAPFSAGATC